jgi:hypothetical protein
MAKRAKYEAHVVIELGARMCTTLKNMYFEDKDYCWLISKEVSVMFTKLKDKAKIYYPEIEDGDLMHELLKWRREDIREALNE